jgi:ubiquinone/menaquinone biosynthesis C-methylase UbiE
MGDFFKDIYNNKSDQYDRLVSREDHRGNLFAALTEIRPLEGLTIVDMGAGTGRMTRILALMAARVIAVDQAFSMLATASRVLGESGLENWHVLNGQNEYLPLRSGFADVVVEGWSFGHSPSWYPETWQSHIDTLLAEAARVLRPGGTIILIETLGTGARKPHPPTERLARLFSYWEQLGFHHRWVRTDYQFESVDEADELTRFFFGDALADEVRAGSMTILPECTGLWWKHV